jgi:putative peptidoglycan lipid II flippase
VYNPLRAFGGIENERGEPSVERIAQEGQIARSATLVSIGNVLSRAMGLVRESVIAGIFGASGSVSAYTAASQVPFTLYEMLIGGMTSSALVPLLSEQAASERRDELWRVASLLFTLAALMLAGLILLLEFTAPLVTTLLVKFDAPLQAETTRLLRIVLVSVFFLGLSGLATALSQALQRFALPAFTTVVFNAGIVTAALLFGPRFQDVRVLAVGLVIGAALQVILQIPALRDMRFRFIVDLRHPVLRHILRLYLPVVLSLVVASFGVLLDRNLASRTGASSISWMRYATTLIQFPLGLISAAISTAILPTLSRQATQENGSAGSGDFCDTLAGGLRLVLVLTIPAAVGLFVLARPVVALLFQHGDFGPADTDQTSLALRYYLIGLTFAAVDLPLVYAFYARQDTWRPAMVGILGVGFYLVVALATVRSLGMIGLILANGAQLAGHAGVMLWLFQRQVGSLLRRGIGWTLLQCGAASAAMAAGVCAVEWGIGVLIPAAGIGRWAATVAAGGIVGATIYVGLCALMRVNEIELAKTFLGQLVRRLRALGRQST